MLLPQKTKAPSSNRSIRSHSYRVLRSNSSPKIFISRIFYLFSRFQEKSLQANSSNSTKKDSHINDTFISAQNSNVFLQNKSCPIIRADTIKPKGLPSQRQQYQSKHDHRKNGESAVAHASFKFIRHPYENSILIIIIFNGKISLPHHSERLHLSQTHSLFNTAC